MRCVALRGGQLRGGQPVAALALAILIRTRPREHIHAALPVSHSHFVGGVGMGISISPGPTSALPVTSLPPDHPERFSLAEEVHARPPELLPTPARASYLAVLVDADERVRETAHLARLCERYAVPPPARELTNFSAHLGALRLKWERHGEFSSWTLIAPGVESAPFAEPATSLLPAGWLRELPGLTVMAAHALIAEAQATPPDEAELARHFEDHLVVGADRNAKYEMRN